MRQFLYIFSPAYIKALIYMLQSSEYHALKYLQWYWRTSDFSKVMYRRSLDYTPKARLLLNSLRLLYAVLILIGLVLIVWWFEDIEDVFLIFFGIAIIMFAPLLIAHILVVPLLLGEFFIQRPKERKLIAQSQRIFAGTHAKTIAIAGSYGKTTVKEILATVLGEGMEVAATPANFNTPLAHARFANTLTGSEQVLIVEYGEFEPGDIAEFAKTTVPDIGVITGLNESHLESFGTLEQSAKNLFALATYLRDKNVYVAGYDAELMRYAHKKHEIFNDQSVLGWKIYDIHSDLSGTTFAMKKDKKMSISVTSQLIGKHLVPALALAAALGHKLGMSIGDIEKGLAATKPFAHRMQPVVLPGEVTLIDDTYNGSIDGVSAGLSLLSSATANRKVYVTPGLVEQGERTEAVHMRLGELIAQSDVQTAYIMKNSVTNYILHGMELGGYDGEFMVVDDPLYFYENIESISRAGDIILMQNDWTDNYA